MVTQTIPVSFQYSHTIGRSEFSGPGFRSPMALARGSEDRIYVVNRSYEYRPDGKRVTVCTVDEDYIGEFARGVTAQGEGEDSAEDGSLIWPTSLALDSKENVYVADEWLNRISIFSRDGDWLGKWGTPGDGDGQINRPSGIAFDADDNMLLVDSVNNRVQKFTKDGRFLAKWGSAGSGDGEFNLPWGLDVDKEGNVYVVDWRNDRVQKFSHDGRFLMKVGSSGSGDGQLSRPTGVAVDKDGVIYVADQGNDRLQVFAPDGSPQATVTGDATMSKWGKEKLDANAEMWHERDIAQGIEREKQFWAPIAVEVDDENRIFVLELPRNRIQIYRKQFAYFYGGRL